MAHFSLFVLRVVELFAGIGGFRVGLENADPDFFRFVWANQWEPGAKRQYAHEIYERHFGKGSCSNVDINLVNVDDIPDFDMMCAGFPCQDYSVAKPLANSDGIYGEKGVLWWQIERILRQKGDKRPSLVLLENVDRLLTSPGKSARGRDFSIILLSLFNLGYDCHWMVIDPSVYGMPQRRKRLFILAYRKGFFDDSTLIIPSAFGHSYNIYEESIVVFNGWNQDIARLNLGGFSVNYGVCGRMVDGKVVNVHLEGGYKFEPYTLGDVLVDKDYPIDESCFIPDDKLEKWRYVKGAKAIERVAKDGHRYLYKEGAVAFPDRLDRASRTMTTIEGSATPNRSIHVVVDRKTGRLRRLLPIEAERLDMFPDGWTEGIPDRKRFFLLGNALVTDVVRIIGERIGVNM